MDYSIILPSKPRIVEEGGDKGVYEIDGLYPGYGYTFGNSIRRTLLSSLPGAAVTRVKIEGAKHEFSTIPGIKEDVISIILNLKQLRVKIFSDEPQTLRLKIKGEKEVKAGDFQKVTQVEVVNPDLNIATITDKNTTLEIEIVVERGLGYVPKDVLQKEKVETGSILLDAVFAPIKRVNYEVENMRIGDRTDYNRLRLTIQTDGTISPREALENAIGIMIGQLKAVVGFKEDPEEKAPEKLNEEDVVAKETKEVDDDILKVRIEELNLSGRTLNSLTEVGIRTVGGLVRKNPEDLLALEGVGNKTIEDIQKALERLGLSLKEQ
ncbi:MAG: DNA-directed RNA polymerase subunit alpha [Candidatus Niyogibacteria bacterium CG10_big_fil_rev_8_21_14_0_10_42_19]|uniref:DNA-directed RNA polymerase subunit alpha n=1 Tax=Candidatus Niyogibacteria bacterium CG10_big_fil_rev_8_21_14_0_10_42_19 TaxID=1974725 RepID=A0A2H0TFP1_9BACT|nr:MAG: DNA-directed RNA polymerase subunit alpha [Candidatus Niyogibacteria bacterium CG10_big_fil_rev_8_21_14_0_10_42_19]